MRFGFYPKLALDGIRKNKRMYLPYFLTCVGMVMMHYIVCSIQYNESVKTLSGASLLIAMMNFGGWVIAIFACIFLFYTNSFLLRRRKKEFGLYNILGMDKINLSRILFWETLFIFISSTITGLFFGQLLSKLAEAGMVRMLNGTVTYDLSLAADALLISTIIFAAIHLLILLNGLRQIWFSSALSLSKSENVGEQPPKANWFFGLVGFIILAAAYYIAVKIEDPITALVWFFVAVIMVIIATYLIMISGSVLLCRILQKNKNYYYKAKHFVSVSSMTYRMKRNGAGLASICILSTMVLVMISAPATLFIGSEESLNNRYPRDFISTYRFTDKPELLADDNISALRCEANKFIKENDIKALNIMDYRTLSIEAYIKGDDVIFDYQTYFDQSKTDLGIYSSMSVVCFIPIDDYNQMMGTNETLADNEVLLYPYRINAYPKDNVYMQNIGEYKVKKILDNCIISGNTAANIASTLILIVSDIDAIAPKLVDNNGSYLAYPVWEFAFDIDGDDNTQKTLFDKFADLYSEKESAGQFTSRSVSWQQELREEFYSTYAGLFYLGIMLSIVFIFGAVLIIYYKQVSEGYEDASRFEIMQKVGMTKKEIRKSINSQLLTVFFLPLLTAGLHLTFAFPMIEKLLRLFNLFNTRLFAITTVICFLAFALCYVIVYKITSNAYYNIVSDVKSD